MTDINELIKVTIKDNIECAQNGVHELLWIMMGHYALCEEIGTKLACFILPVSLLYVS